MLGSAFVPLLRFPRPAGALLALLTVIAPLTPAATADSAPPTATEAVTYEMFGAKGDAVTDDLPAIVAAHAHANELGRPVRSRPDATYHLGTRALTAIIQTDTDWNTSRFIIDDSRGVEDHKRPLFEVRSRFAPVPLPLTRLAAGQPRLDLRPDHDLLVLVENDQRRRFIRRGLNRNNGTPQREVFILRRDGTIDGAIEWDYDTVTRVEARPIDPTALVVRGGIFTQVANRMKQPVGYNYWSRHIEIRRSNTVIDGVTLHLEGEGEFGHPYNGFLRAQQVAHITFRHCRIAGRKVYKTIGAAGEPVSMGTYGYRADLVVNFQMLHCRMENDIHDRTRWGVAATNFMKNVLIEDCLLSRMDVHMGVSGGYVIRRSTLGHQGLKAIGRGLLLVEDTAIHSASFIDLRTDYGSTWDGDVIVRNSRWIIPPHATRPSLFNLQNDGTHDFGYPCTMPRTVRLDGLFIDDSALPPGPVGVTIFKDPDGAPPRERPFPYRVTERLELRRLQTASGRPPRVSDHPALAAGLATTIE